MPNLKLLRVRAKVDELFKDKIDLSDTTNPDEKGNKFYTRSLAALAVVMRCEIEYDVATQSVTDGSHVLDVGTENGSQGETARIAAPSSLSNQQQIAVSS